MLAAWFLGSEAGNALADILTGEGRTQRQACRIVARGYWANPDLLRPAHEPAGPPSRIWTQTSKYLDVPVAPLFPFGHGLSYTQFAYSGLRVSTPVLGPEGRLSVEADVENRGLVAGEETCFLFIRDIVASVARPVLELRGLAKIALDPGERERSASASPQPIWLFRTRMAAPGLRQARSKSWLAQARIRPG